MKFYATLFLLLSAVFAFGQSNDDAKVVSTSADLVAVDPILFANSSPGTNSTFMAVVSTTGDTAAGSGTKHWLWVAASTTATNTAANKGPLAYPYGSSSGRWVNVPSSSVSDGIVTLASLGGDITAAGKALLDDADASAQRTTLGLGALATAADGTHGDVTTSGANFTINASAVTTAKLGGDITAAGKALLDDASASAQRTTLGLGALAITVDGTHGDVSTSGDTFTIVSSAVTTAKLGGDITAAGKELLDDASASAQRTTLGLGTLAIVSPTGSASSSTWLRGDGTWNTIATSVTDGDKGDITVSGSGATWNIDAGVVTTTELGGDITTYGKDLLTSVSVSDQRDTLGLGSLALQGDGDKGDVVVSSGGATFTVDSSAISYTKIQNVTGASKVLGRGDSGAGAVQELAVGSGLQIIGTTISATGVASSTNESSVTVLNVSAMLALAPAVVTNGAVSVRTLARTSGVIGGGIFKYIPNGAATTNLGTVFNYAYGQLIYIGPEPGDVELYGADGEGSTDSTSAFTSASTYAASINRRVYIPGKTFYISGWNIPDDSTVWGESLVVLKLYAYPTWPGGSVSAQANLVKDIVRVNDRTTIDLNGGYIDAQYGVLTATSWDMANLHVRGVTDVRILNVHLRNSFAHSFVFRYSTNIYCKDLYLEDRSGAGQIAMSKNVFFERGMSLNQVFGTPAPDAQHIVDQIGNENVRWKGFVIRNATAYTGASYAFSGWTCGGDTGTVFEDCVFEPVGGGTVVNGAAILLDGCRNSAIERCHFYGWNTGASTPIELSSPRNVTLRDNFIDGMKDYDDDREDGGAGIFIIDNGIWPVDTESKIWNEGGNQWRARNSGANVTIVGNTVQNCFNGVLFTSSYSQLLNNTITGNRNFGVAVGRVGNGGTASFAWVNGLHHKTVGCRIAGNTIAWNGMDGIKIEKAEDLEISENRIFNNGQYGTAYNASGISNSGTVDQGQINLRNNFIGNKSAVTLANVSLDPSQDQWVVVSARTTTTGSDSTHVVSSTSMTANEYYRYYLRIQSTGQTVRISSNTSSTLTLEAGITAPGSGVAFDIIEVPRYKVTSDRLEEIVPGQRLILKGVQTGAVDMGGFVEGISWGRNDEFYFRPCGSASGTFNSFYLLGWQATAGGAIVAGTGTMTYDGTSNYSPNGTLKVTMSVAVAGELDSPFWIGLDPGTGTYEWRRVQRALGFGGVTTEMYVNEKFSQAFSGKSFRISKFNGEFSLGQKYGINFSGSPAKLNIIGSGNSFGGNVTAAIVSTSSPDVPYVRVPDSATPTLPDEGDKFQIANSTPKTITSIGGGWEGREVKLFYLSGSVPTFDCTTSSITSQDGADKVLTVGSVVNAVYSNGKWRCNFVIP